jgi:hypothetical protein
MTTFVNFQPVPNQPFQFQATLDNQVYLVLVTWSLFGSRWYVNIYDPNNNLIVCLPQIGSPLDYDINLVPGYFKTSTLIWRPETGQFEITP